ncbi:hypothetical protein B0T25DRAFT_550469 [Lasiosphaeria hispida]|uniref:Uncharacterized protein n=1 Tax=Lasiosphaeria hispida TaxID=260671 RepID=A0AAJ0MA72_9PEZI|nr:hypothetical protein B0T25DRAFT_550469 [Lasiosphaeria hispida]
MPCRPKAWQPGGGVAFDQGARVIAWAQQPRKQQPAEPHSFWVQPTPPQPSPVPLFWPRRVICPTREKVTIRYPAMRSQSQPPSVGERESSFSLASKTSPPPNARQGAASNGRNNEAVPPPWAATKLARGQPRRRPQELRISNGTTPIPPPQTRLSGHPGVPTPRR